MTAAEAVDPQGSAADPKLSGSPATDDDEPLVFTADRDPADRWFDRLLAKVGVLDDAAPLFRDGERVPRAGVLLALPANRRTPGSEVDVEPGIHAWGMRSHARFAGDRDLLHHDDVRS